MLLSPATRALAKGAFPAGVLAAGALAARVALAVAPAASPCDEPLAAPASAPAAPAPLAEDVVVRVARLSRDGAPGLAALRGDFAARNPGYGVAWHPAFVATAAGAGESRVLFVQAGEGVAEGASPPLRRGDVVVLRDGESIRLGGAPAVVEFTVPTAAPAEVPRLVRPDFDPRITDTPGGCADEQDAYRRVLITWLGKNGPYLFHALNAHRVRIRDSFTHYHPAVGGFDEFYLVQGVEEGARLITSLRTDRVTRPDEVTRAEAASLLESRRLEVGDLVYLPRGVIHRGVGGVLAQVITVPGFQPMGELGVDHHLRRINERLRLEGPDALPLHAEGAKGPVIK